MSDTPITPVPPASPSSEAVSGKSNPLRMQYIVIGLGIVVLAVIVWSVFLSAPAPIPTGVDNSTSTLAPGEVPATLDDPQANLQALKTTLSKEKFLQKLYETNRDQYNLYEQAAKNMGISVSQVQQFFFDCCDLKNEADIYSELPPVPDDFSKVAYDVSAGRLYQVGLLGKEYYAQPEFYTFVDQETGVVNRHYAFLPWSDPHLDQWGDNGMQTYPGDLFDTLSFSGRQTFNASVFVTNAWNIQNFVGITLVTDQESSKYFDISISEDQTGKPYFLLGPTFPRFDKDWATKVFITGKVKPGTPPGDYIIGIDPVGPPAELNDKWSTEHAGLYAPYGFLRPSDHYITLHVTVTN